MCTISSSPRRTYAHSQQSWLTLGVTKDEVKANCDDLKVLGKGDFKALIKWRLALREEVSTFTIFLMSSWHSNVRDIRLV